MSDCKQILIFSNLVMTGGMFCTAAVTIAMLYQTTLEDERRELVKIAIGETGDLVIAQREGDQIVCLFPCRHGDGGNLDPVPWASGLAQPLRSFARRRSV